MFVLNIFEDVAMVRKVSATKSGSAHMWGSFQATEMLREYTRNKWIKHARAADMLTLTSIQREGKLVGELTKTGTKVEDDLGVLKAEVIELKDGFKGPKKKNPSLK